MVVITYFSVIVSDYHAIMCHHLYLSSVVAILCRVYSRLKLAFSHLKLMIFKEVLFLCFMTALGALVSILGNKKRA